ncbi:MAG: ABC transporter permease [Planctomycetota bacterium]
MLAYAAKRLLMMLPTLVGISLVVFLMMDLAPADRAEIELARQTESGGVTSEQRAEALLQLRVRYGLIDPATHEPLPVWRRYARWLGDALRLRLSGPDEDERAFRRRILDALPVTFLIGFWALSISLAVGVPLGAWLGVRAGTGADRLVSGVLFLAVGVPEFMLAALLLLLFGGGVLDWFPPTGLRSPGAEELPFWGRILDLARHLMLPVLSLSLPPIAQISRFLRESVSRAARAPFATSLRAAGVEPSLLKRRLLRVGLSPLVTLLGGLLPWFFSGSVVVESVFGIDGIGRLAYDSVLRQDQGMVMALALLASAITLFALALSDVLQRVIDPRVRLE